MAHRILQSDLAEMRHFSSGEVDLHSTDGVTQLQVPMFYGDETGYITTVKLYPDQRPHIEWSRDRSQMYRQYTEVGSTDVFFDGTYALDSHRDFVVTISEGVPARPDFVAHTAQNRAWCCPEAKSFILMDPSLGDKMSTYTQVTDRLLLECSQNNKGKVFLWRRG